jgi:PAS domain S-box-containing protein
VLRESEGRLKRAQQVAHLGNWEWDLITNKLYWAEENYRIHGIDPQKVKPSYEAFIQVVDPAEHEFVNKAVADALADKRSLEFDYTVIRPDNGEKCIINSKADVLVDSAGKAVKMVGTVQDITERRQIEKAMQESEARLIEAQRIARIGNWELNLATNTLTWSDEIFRIFEIEKERLGASYEAFLDAIHPEDRDAVNTAYTQSLETGNPYKITHRLLMRDGRIKHVQEQCETYYSQDGKPLRSVGIVQDITDRKQAQRNQELSAQILGILNESVALPDAINSILTAIKQETGFDAVGIRLRNGEDFPYFVQNGFSYDFLLTENTLTVRDKDGGICRDTNGKASLECTCGLVLSGQADLTNPLFTPGGSAWTNNSLPLLDLPAADDPRLHPRNRCIHEGFCSLALIPVRVNQEIVGLLQLNDRRKDRFTLEMIEFFEGISASIGVALMHKQAEETIKKSLEEKEVLLREIHHRVKNNMQIVSSLLMLQSQNIEDAKYKDMFLDSQTRIYSMALIHEKLYQSESIAHINFKEYIDGIVSNIFESYCIKSNIKIDINVENIPIKIDYAIPCGLIINELVTNSLKYAFPDGRQGKIQLSLKSNDNNMVQLSISDDGIGIAKDMDIRNTKSLGLHLVTALAEGQLHGKIILNRERGTEFQIGFGAK